MFWIYSFIFYENLCISIWKIYNVVYVKISVCSIWIPQSLSDLSKTDFFLLSESPLGIYSLSFNFSGVFSKASYIIASSAVRALFVPSIIILDALLTSVLVPLESCNSNNYLREEIVTYHLDQKYSDYFFSEINYNIL